MGRSPLNSPALGNFVVYKLLKFRVRGEVKTLDFMKFSIRGQDAPVRPCSTFGFQGFGNNLFFFPGCVCFACCFCSPLRADASGEFGKGMPFTAYIKGLIPSERSTFDLVFT